MFTRLPASMALDTSRNLIKDLHEGSPSDKMLDIDLLSAYVQQYSLPEALANEKAFAQQFMALIDNSRSDTTPGAKLWASYAFSVLLGSPEDQTKAIDLMLKSTAWESRLLGLYAARLLSPEVQKQIASKLAVDDANDLVKAYAASDRGTASNTQRSRQPQRPRRHPCP